MSVKIFHNPRCSKSRQALQLLKDRGIEPIIVEYLKTPPTTAELTEILALLDKAPREIMRKAEKEYKENGLENPALTQEQLISAMVKHPVLIERPIVLANGKAAIGRPPENVLNIVQ
jgi:arsenate reductase (glutaredoxin)